MIVNGRLMDDNRVADNRELLCVAVAGCLWGCGDWLLSPLVGTPGSGDGSENSWKEGSLGRLRKL